MPHCRSFLLSSFVSLITSVSRTSVFFFSFLVLITIWLSPDSLANAAKAIGFVRIEQIDGVWWFIGPDGDKFVSNGVNHIEPHLWLAPYNKDVTLNKYGNDMVDEHGHFNTHGKAAKRWIDHQVEICEDLHFNTFAKHTHDQIDPELYKDQIYYVISLETAPLSGWRERKGQGPRPDVFSEDYRNYVDKVVRGICMEHKDSRNLLGYLYTDVPSWIMGRAEQKEQDNYVMIYPWVNAILGLGDSSPGKQKWIQHLKSRYASSTEAANVWGMEVSPTYGIPWDYMARLTTWFSPKDEAKAKDDMLSFLPVIADKYYGLHRELVHKYDPNHLLFGDKNMVMWHYDFVLPALKKHVDVISIQAYGRWGDDSKLVSKIYEATGKPVFNGDGCYGFAGPNQQVWGIKGFRTGAESVEDVAMMYKDTMEGMMSTPYVVGWHHCGYLEQWDAAERGDAPRNENGFLDPFENYRTAWTDVIKDVNARATQIHENSK